MAIFCLIGKSPDWKFGNENAKNSHTDIFAVIPYFILHLTTKHIWHDCTWLYSEILNIIFLFNLSFLAAIWPFINLILLSSKQPHQPDVIHPILNALTLSYDGGPYHIETSPLICRANQWTDFYMTGTSIMKELNTEPLSLKRKKIP